MSEWKKCAIGNVVTLRQGFAINAKSKHYISKEPTSLALLRIADMKSGSREIYVKEDIPKNFIALPQDIIYTRTGNVGLVFRNNYGVVHNNCFTVTPNDERTLSRDFLYYLLQSKYFFEKANSLARGAAQPDLPHSLFNSIEIAYPELDSQQRIASILSRYDSLIENYQKQIKLLEEAAQRLYKEWFVDLHFPGHENTKIVDGVPEGWEKGRLEDIAFESGKKVDKKSREDYEYYMPIDSLPKHSLTYLSPADISMAESSLVSFKEGDVIFGAMRPYFHKVCFAQSSGLTRSTCFVLNAKVQEYQGYLLMLMFDENTVKHATSISVGTTMPYTRWKEFKSMQILIPSKDLATIFGEQISLTTKRLKKLSTQIRLLTEARDRLLPKLMSGEIAV